MTILREVLKWVLYVIRDTLGPFKNPLAHSKLYMDYIIHCIISIHEIHFPRPLFQLKFHAIFVCWRSWKRARKAKAMAQ